MRRVSDILREERERQGYSLSDIQKALKIRKEFLVAIEEGRLHDLPSESYALGFVKNYAAFLGLDRTIVSAFFRREYKREDRINPPVYQSKSSKYRKKPLFHVGNIGVIVVSLWIAAYIVFQYGSLLFNPKLEVISPKEGEVISNSIISVSGVTDQYATVTIDGQQAFVGLDGSFKKSIYVFPGEKEIEVIARSRFGKETKIIRTVLIK